MMHTGISWLHDTLVRRTKERMVQLQEKAAAGVSDRDEYWATVGRYKEARHLLTVTIPDLFKDFEQSDSEEEGDEF